MKIKTLIQLLILTMLCLLAFSCTEYEKYHVKSWQGAFFIDDTTLGVVGWEWDEDVKTSGFDETDFFNVYQYFFKYYINSKTLERIETLQSGVVRNLSYDFLAFHYPVLYYSTFTDKLETGIFNLETLENKLLRDDGNYPSTGKPTIVSSKGNYLGFKYAATEFNWGIWDTIKEKIIFSSFTQRPVCINDSLNKAILLLEPYNLEKWFLLYDITTGNIDTLFENSLGNLHYVINNNITIYTKYNTDSLIYVFNKDLFEKKNIFHELPHIQLGSTGTIDINLNTGYCVQKGKGKDFNFDINLTDYKSGKSEAILKYSKEERN